MQRNAVVYVDSCNAHHLKPPFDGLTASGPEASHIGSFLSGFGDETGINGNGTTSGHVLCHQMGIELHEVKPFFKLLSETLFRKTAIPA
ncbi:MAG: hypothetical protein BGO29_04720 [Bacteroidales bacterium 36-12]|nr:MAG: hypothetical protein BGO29_04720 [Bacteroidales bacterium 36-12]